MQMARLLVLEVDLREMRNETEMKREENFHLGFNRVTD
jgi:hypothetical protein